MDALLARDLRLAASNLSSWLPGVLFFLIFMTVSVIAIGPASQTLQDLAPGLIWLGFVFSLILTASSLFYQDMTSGMTEQIFLSGLSKIQFVLAKAITVFIINVLPILLIIPLVGLALGVEARTGWTIALSILTASPAIIFYMLVTAAILSRQSSSGFVGVIMVLPLLIPILIFGVSAAQLQIDNPLQSSEFRALMGLNLISFAICIPAIIAALKANID